MSLSKRTKEIIGVIGAIVLVGSTSAGVVKFFEKQVKDHLISQHTTEIQNLTRRMGTIERRLGSDDDYLDVRKLWVDEDHVAKHLQTSIYYPDDEFYAANHRNDESHWIYEKTTDQEFLERLIQNEKILTVLRSSNAYPIHLWRGEPMQEITGTDLIRSVFPAITVQRFPMGNYTSEIQKGLKEGMQIGGKITRFTLEDNKKDELLKTLENYFMSDVALKLFILHYSVMEGFNNISPKFDYEVLKLQKIGNVLYAQYRSVFSEVSVGGKPFDKYYLYQEVMIITTEKDLFFVETRIPTSERVPRDIYFGHTAQWLGEFAILRNR